MAGTSAKVSRALFKEVFIGGQSVHSSLFTVKTIVKTGLPVSFSVVVSAKVAKKAVKRNLIKRRVRAVLTQLKSQLKPGSVIIVFTKSTINTASYGEIRDQLVTNLKPLTI